MTERITPTNVIIRATKRIWFKVASSNKFDNTFANGKKC